MDKIITACFSGYRPEKFEFPLEASCPKYVRLLEGTRLTIADAVAEGNVNILVAWLVDLICGPGRFREEFS